MEVNALQLLRNHIATSREEAYELLSHIRIHDAQPIVFRFRYQNPKTGQEQTRALLAIGYNDKSWGRTTNKIIWDDVLIEEQINDLYENIARLDKRIDDEIDRATKAEQHLQDEIDELDDRLEKEIKRATETEAEIDKILREEIQRSTDFDKYIDEKLSKEITDARAGEARATTVVVRGQDAETRDHLKVVHSTDGVDGHNIYTLDLMDVASQTDLNTTNTNLEKEIERAKAEERRIEDKLDNNIQRIDDEIVDLKDKDVDLQSQIDDLRQDIDDIKKDLAEIKQSIENVTNNTYTKDQIDEFFSNYYDKSHIDNHFYDRDYINNHYYDSDYIDNHFYNITQMGNLYFNKEEVNNLIKGINDNLNLRLKIENPLRELLEWPDNSGINYVVNGRLFAMNGGA